MNRGRYKKMILGLGGFLAFILFLIFIFYSDDGFESVSEIDLNYKKQEGEVLGLFSGEAEPEHREFIIEKAEAILVTSAKKPRKREKVGEIEEVDVKKLLINCIQTTGGPGKATEDLVEIYNPNNERVNLKGYRLVKRTKVGSKDGGIKSWIEEDFIEPYGVYVWANSAYGDVDANISTTATISDNNGVALRFGSANTGEIVDSVAWGEAENVFIEGRVFGVNPGSGERICRKDFVDSDDNSQDFKIIKEDGYSPEISA